MGLKFDKGTLLSLRVTRMVTNMSTSICILSFIPGTGIRRVGRHTSGFCAVVHDERPSAPIVFLRSPVFARAHFSRHVTRRITQGGRAIGTIFRSLGGQKRGGVCVVSSGSVLKRSKRTAISNIRFASLKVVHCTRLIYPIVGGYVQ